MVELTANIKRFYKAAKPWQAALFLFVFTDFLLYLINPGINKIDISYLLGVLASSLFFYALDKIILHFKPKWRIFVYVPFTLIFSFIYISNIALYFNLNEYTNSYVFSFFVSNFSYALAFIHNYLTGIYLFIFIIINILMFSIYYNLINNYNQTNYSYKLTLKSKIAIILYFVILNQITIYFPQSRLQADIASVRAIKLYFKNNSNSLTKKVKYDQIVKLERTNSNANYNIILIIHESFGNKALTFDKSGEKGMPFLDSMIKSNSSFIKFDNFYASAGATDVAMPSILTGYAPFQDFDKFANFPFLWDWAKSANYKTFFVSSQSYNWGNFLNYFFRPGPDQWFTADRLNFPNVNDYGIDDKHSMDKFTSLISTTHAKDKFFAIYNSNALHDPFQKQSDFYVLPKMKSNYLKASRILDNTFKSFYNEMKNQGKLENTIIMITGDHGETDSLIHKSNHRLFNFYNEIVKIPFVFVVPEKVKNENPSIFNNLKDNQNKIYSNYDLAPTIFDLLQFDKNFNVNFTKNWIGKSILDTNSNQRYVISLNTNDIRQWDPEGFGIHDNQFDLVCNTVDGIKLFDKSDILQLNNIWHNVADDKKKYYLEIIFNHKHLENIYKKLKNTGKLS